MRLELADYPVQNIRLGRSCDYGAGTLAGADGKRQPSENELAIARFQGRHVAEIAARLTRSM